MGADTTVYVKVVKECEAWVEVQAVTLTEAKQMAFNDKDVIRVVGARYDKPGSEWDDVNTYGPSA